MDSLALPPYTAACQNAAKRSPGASNSDAVSTITIDYLGVAVVDGRRGYGTDGGIRGHSDAGS